MSFYYLNEYMKLLNKQKRERAIFLANGFKEETLQELFLLDRQQLRSDEKYYHRISSYIDDELADELAAMSDEYFDVMENIDNADLYNGLKMLSPEELNVLINHAVCDESLKNIAIRQGKSESTIRNTYARARKKVKKFF